MKCGIDPGRHKTGVAFAEDGRLLFSAIVPRADLAELARIVLTGPWKELEKWREEGSADELSGRRLEKVYIGNGTSSADVDKLFAPCEVEIVDERNTTLDGRKLYWKIHKPRGLWRLIPTSLRVPKRNIDDLAAFLMIKEP